FFFQAEDGIRYWSVTGVQTCALPISSLDAVERFLAFLPGPGCLRVLPASSAEEAVQRGGGGPAFSPAHEATRGPAPPARWTGTRTEERRVGEEGRAWGRAGE